MPRQKSVQAKDCGATVGGKDGRTWFAEGLNAHFYFELEEDRKFIRVTARGVSLEF